MNRPQFIHRFLRAPVIMIGSVVLLFLLGVATVRESYRGWKVDQEINALESEARELEGRNKRLMEIAQNLHSPERMEVEARKRLGLKQPGEHVVILDNLAASSSWQMQLPLDVVAVRAEIHEPNPVQWFNYFFRPENLD